uniref:ORF protein n=3 Tax=melanogaster subgroup TaxID=32351 RepID=Q24258_DROME|nr:ORF [Drosophila melanogaster]
MPKTKELTVEARAGIVARFKAGTPAAKIAEIYQISRRTVYYLIKKFDTVGTLKNKKRSGRKPVLDQRQCRQILGVVAKNPSASPVKIALESKNTIGKQVSSSTIRRRLKEADFKTYVVRKTIEITPTNKTKRLRFALEYVKKPLDFWFNILWTDESAFQYQGSYSKHFMHLKNNQKHLAAQPTNRFGGGTVMFWGCLSYYGFGDLVPIEGTLNQNGYLLILNNHAFTSGNRLFPTTEWILQQDNAPCHKGRIPTKFLNDLNLAVLPWPPQSPDLNIIENVWAFIKNQRTIDKNRKREGAIIEIAEIWSKLTLEFAQTLVRSIPKRLQAVIDAKGGVTKY